MSSKKPLILLIFKILESESDRDHPMRQTDIARIISAVMPCDRKTVARNIVFLRALGYPIVKTPRGFFLDRKYFTVAESRYVFDAVSAFEAREGIKKDELIDKLWPVIHQIVR